MANIDLQKIEGQAQENLGRSFGSKDIQPGFFRLLCLLSLWAYLAIWTTGFLKLMIAILCLPLLIQFVMGRKLLKNSFFAHGLSFVALLYAIWESLGPVPGVIILLRFASTVLMLQLLIVDSNRSANGVQILCLMIILAVAAMNVNFLFPMVVIPFLLTFYRSLGEMSLIKHRFQSHNYKKVTGRLQDTFAQALASSLVSIAFFGLFWLVIFYVIPRNESFGLASETSRRRLRGFSNTLDIGDSGLLEDNPAVIMRIRPLENKTLTYSVIRRISNKLLRGAAFSTYRNGSWQRGTKRRWLVDLRKNQGELKLLNITEDFRNLHPLEFILENNDPPVVFIPDNTVSVNFSTSFISMEEDLSFYFSSRKQVNRRYVANIIHNPIEPSDQLVEGIVLDKRSAAYADITGIPERVVSLANNLSSGTSTISERVDVMIAFLQKNCMYSLNQLPTERDPIEEFLFFSKSGTCEHFASALAVLLRCSGIPARPVGGYTFGDWNEVGGFFTVRQRHAHAWVEVFYPRSGWVPVDPTPSTEVDGYETEVGRFFQALWENYEGYWFTYVYNFDNKTQNVGYRKIAGSLDSFLQKLYSIPVFYLAASFLALLVPVLFYAWFWYRKPEVRRSWIPECYSLWASKCNFSRLPNETPMEFHLRLRREKIIDDASATLLCEAESLIDEIAFSGLSEKEVLQEKLAKILAEVDLKNLPGSR